MKLDNVMFAFTILESMGIYDNKWNAIGMTTFRNVLKLSNVVDIVRKDLKMIIRVLFGLFQAFNGRSVEASG
jgi:hypothetical protein